MTRSQLSWTLIAGALLCLFVAWGAYNFLPKGKPGLGYTEVSYADLPGWTEDDLAGFNKAFAKSCAAIMRMPADRPLGPEMAGKASEWATACQALADLEGSDLKAGLEEWFVPFAVSIAGRPDGKFTGYYEPMLDGSMTPSETYHVPLYTRPADLIEVDLGRFRDDLKGRRIAGTSVGGKLVPYPNRAEIVDGALEGKVEPLLWVDDPIDAFFLQIQGSGRVRMPDGSVKAVGYAGQNGHIYFAISRLLIREGHGTREELSMQFIRRWLNENPSELNRVLNSNASYIFFRDLGDVDGPYGSGGVTLTPGRSLAVDRVHLPMHMPIYLSTVRPDADDPSTKTVPFQRLMMAQDTGGAIVGEIRGDVFWGPGEDAATIAGHMNSAGRYFVLLPKSVALKRQSEAS